MDTGFPIKNGDFHSFLYVYQRVQDGAPQWCELVYKPHEYYSL